MENKQDSFLTVTRQGEGLYKEKGSKFLGFAIPCSSAELAKEKIETFRKEHHNACHVCFAWRFGTTNYEDRFSDDGEPNNSAGKPIFGQIKSFEVTNTLIAVVRYYGGTNLGVGGLITAYKTAAKEALQDAKIDEKPILASLKLTHEFEDTGSVMSLLNKINAQITAQTFENNKPAIHFNVRMSQTHNAINTFIPLPKVEVLLQNI